MNTIINSLLSAIGAVSIFLVPMLVVGLLDERKRRRDSEEELRREEYARMVLNQTLQDAVENGVGGKVLRHLIETGQL